MGSHDDLSASAASIPPTSATAEGSVLPPVTTRFDRWIHVAAILTKVVVGVIGLVTLL